MAITSTIVPALYDSPDSDEGFDSGVFDATGYTVSLALSDGVVAPDWRANRVIAIHDHGVTVWSVPDIIDLYTNWPKTAAGSPGWSTTSIPSASWTELRPN